MGRSLKTKKKKNSLQNTLFVTACNIINLYCLDAKNAECSLSATHILQYLETAKEKKTCLLVLALCGFDMIRWLNIYDHLNVFFRNATMHDVPS